MPEKYKTVDIYSILFNLNIFIIFIIKITRSLFKLIVYIILIIQKNNTLRLIYIIYKIKIYALVDFNIIFNFINYKFFNFYHLKDLLQTKLYRELIILIDGCI